MKRWVSHDRIALLLFLFVLQLILIDYSDFRDKQRATSHSADDSGVHNKKYCLKINSSSNSNYYNCNKSSKASEFQSKSLDKLPLCKKFKDRSSVTMKIIWVIGGPGCGKGTQCSLILEKYKLVHISSGDLLRAEVESGSEKGKELQKIMEKGELIDTSTVLELINKKIESCKSDPNINGFLIDGYPRELEQGKLFEKSVGCVNLIIFFDVANETLLKRLMARAQGSTRADDNEETIKNRIKLFNEKNGPIADFYGAKVLRVNAEGTVESIFETVSKTLDQLFAA